RVPGLSRGDGAGRAPGSGQTPPPPQGGREAIVALCESFRQRCGCWNAARYEVGALSVSTLPTVSFHSLAHSPPQRLAQPARPTPATSCLWVGASSGLTGPIVDLASLPMVQGCWPVLQLSASAVIVLIVAHILSS